MNSAAYPELAGNLLSHNDKSGQFSPFAFFTNFYFLMLSAFFSLFVSHIHRHVQYRSYLYALCLTIQRFGIFFHEHTNRFLFLALSFGLLFFPFISCAFFCNFFLLFVSFVQSLFVGFCFILSYILQKHLYFLMKERKGEDLDCRGGPEELEKYRKGKT